MSVEPLLRFLFILYCTTVGVVLLLAPWTPGWGQMVAFLPLPSLRMLDLPLLRGALSGFGLVHLVWGFHDLSLLLRHPDEGHGPPTAGDH